MQNSSLVSSSGLLFRTSLLNRIRALTSTWSSFEFRAWPELSFKSELSNEQFLTEGISSRQVAKRALLLGLQHKQIHRQGNRIQRLGSMLTELLTNTESLVGGQLGANAASVADCRSVYFGEWTQRSSVSSLCWFCFAEFLHSISSLRVRSGRVPILSNEVKTLKDQKYTQVMHHPICNYVSSYSSALPVYWFCTELALLWRGRYRL